MTKDQRKLQQLLIDIGKKAETTSPSIADIELLYDRFLAAVDNNDLTAQRRAITALCAALVKWGVERG